MINKWQEITQDNKVKLLVFIFGAVIIPVLVYLGKGWINSPLALSKSVPETVNNTVSQGGVIQTNQSGQNIVNTGSGTINIGIFPEQYEQGLKLREIEVRTELKHAHAKDRQVSLQETQKIQIKLQNIKTSYEEHIASLKERIVQLVILLGQLPDKVLKQVFTQAINALAQGDNQQADLFFKQVEEQANSSIKAAAEAAYQRCLIAEDEVHYLDALKHCEKSARLAPDHSLYLNQAGVINETLANFKKAIAYFEQALASGLKTYGEDHPNVATYRNNLGSAWKSLGEYQKAIGYFEQALASDLKTYGEDHPAVATKRNNLGDAWRLLGKYQKAIKYYKLALASDLKTYGEDHPAVATERNNLGVVWYSLGEYQKALAYYDKALASDLKTYGEDHPKVARVRNNLGTAWALLGNYQKAIAYYDKALASDLKTYGEDHPNVANYRNNLGSVN